MTKKPNQTPTKSAAFFAESVNAVIANRVAVAGRGMCKLDNVLRGCGLLAKRYRWRYAYMHVRYIYKTNSTFKYESVGLGSV